MLTILKIRGVDIHPYIRRGGLNYDWVTRQSRSVVTLDGRLHQHELHRRHLTVRLIKLRDAPAQRLQEALSPGLAQVEYTETDGTTRTITCYVRPVTGSADEVRGCNTYYDGLEFALEEQ